MVRMGPVRIGIVILTVEYLDMLEKIASELEDEIYIVNTGLDDAIDAARQLVIEHNIEVIVARGGTAKLLRENIDLPVLACQRDLIDILDSLHEASMLSQKVLFTAFRKPLAGIELIERLTNTHIKQVIYHSKESLYQAIGKGKKEGYSVVVGGGQTVRFALQHDLQAIEIGIGWDELEGTIASARAIALSNRKKQEETRRYQTVIDSVSEGILAFDQNGQISIINRAAQNLLDLKPDSLQEQNIHNLLNQTSAKSVLNLNRPRIDVVEQINQDHFLLSHFPITHGEKRIGGVSTFKDLAGVLNSENAVRRSLSKGLVARYTFDDIIHVEPRMADMLDQTAHYAQTDSTILITGETGTGKELIAQSIHNCSRRSRGPFVSLNCAALPENLLESELFGYDEGAFTGSKKGGKAGLLEIAHNGSIFLDEISETSLLVQIRLLRVLQEREVMRLGSDRRTPINIRVITATNKDLIDLVQEGLFREDLYFRLDVLHVNVPPLRERLGDIVHLIKYFISKLSRKYSFPEISFPSHCLKILTEYSWPGNVRQLENFIERMIIISEGNFNIQKFENIFEQLSRFQHKTVTNEKITTKDDLIQKRMYPSQDGEIELIKEALKKTNFHRDQAAKLLGISRTTLWKKIKIYQIA